MILFHTSTGVKQNKYNINSYIKTTYMYFMPLNISIFVKLTCLDTDTPSTFAVKRTTEVDGVFVA